MNILITGGSGFIAKDIAFLLKKENLYKIYNPSHNELDVLCLEDIKKYIKNKKIDVILHTACVGGRRTKIDTAEVFYENLLMFENVMYVASFHNIKLINLGSGAEFDRRRHITNFKETDIYNSIPLDYYGLAKNLIAKKIQHDSNIINLRIFNCFSINEASNRFIISALTNPRLVIDYDKYMDFFYMEDLYTVIQHYLNNIDYIHWNLLPKDMNCVYMKKYTLSDIARTIIKTPEIIIENSTRGLNYTGNGRLLHGLQLPLLGLKKSIEKIKDIL